MVWSPFSSPSSRLPLEDVLEIVKKYLDNARKESNPTKAYKLCKDAKSQIKIAEKIFAAKNAKGLATNDGIATAYYEHGDLLESLGYHEKAQKSHRKAVKWGYIDMLTHQVESIFLSLFTPDDLPTASSVTAARPQGNSQPNTVQLTRQSHQETTTKVKNGPSTLNDQEVASAVAKYALPKVGERIANTPQLAYCLSLLHPSLMSKEGLGNIGYDWLQANVNDPNEKKRLQTMATDVVRAFVRDELKKPNVVAEVVSLAAVLNQEDFRKLLQTFVDGIDKSVLLEVHLLDGLAQLIRNAEQDYIDADDLVKILGLLNTRLKSTHKQSTRHIHRLALTMSNVLDSMVDSQVEGIGYEQLHEPLSEYLKELQESSDPYLVYQAAYAYQALQYVPDDETILQTALRRTGRVVQGISGVVSAVKALDLNMFLEGLKSIQGGLAGAGDAIVLVKDAYSKTLTESSFLENLKENLSCPRKSVWYPALRGLDMLLQENRFTEFRQLFQDVPCKQDPAFQWGVCQRLGEVVANTFLQAETRQCALSFLGELYKDDTIWGRANIKQWILRILIQMASLPKGSIANQARELLQELKTNGSAEKRLLYQSCGKDRAGSGLIIVTLPPQESPLLDRVQGKPDVEIPLRQLKRERLKDQGGDVYISPRAKSGLRATDDFDLTSKVQEFLDSDKKVFLILGDSGAGKSTFNRTLEIKLWDKYGKTDRRIPLFIHLPTVKEPERDMIAERLRKANFTEKQIWELKNQYEFILICDGYDEKYNGADYRDCFQPNDRNNNGRPELFQEAVITPFNKSQIQDYIDQYVSLRNPEWASMDYQEAFKQIPNLQDLVKNPFLLKLAMDVLPRLLNTSSNFSAARITRVGLYDEFLAQWIERAKIRLRELDLSSRDKETFMELSGSGFKQNSIEYLKELVTAIYDNQNGNPVVIYLERRDRKTWKEALFNKEDGRHLLREAIPLSRNGDMYRFIHKSVLEYGLALAVFDPSGHEESLEPTSVTSRRMSTNSALSFEISTSMEKTTIATEQPLLDSPLGRKNLVGEASIIQFLTERVRQQPGFKDQLLAVIERSKTDKMARTAAANAITILVRAGIQFNGADLRGIQVPGADLSFGVFDSSQLEGADLRKANLRNIWLRRANLSGAQMTGVQFGELPFLQEDSEVTCSVYSPNGRLLAVALEGGYLHLYETASWNRIWSLGSHSSGAEQVAFSPTSHQIALKDDGKAVLLWDIDTRNCTHALQGHTHGITAIKYSPKGNRVATGSFDKTVRLWDVETGDCVHILQGHSDGIWSIVYSPDGNQVASGGDDSTLRLWSTDTGDCIHVLRGHTNKVWSIAYSPKGDRIASASFDSTVRLWDVDTGRCIYNLVDHKRMALCVAYSPRGDQIASGGMDFTVRLWDVVTGNCIHILPGHGGGVTNAIYSPKGDQIASSGRFDKTVRIWNVETGDPVYVLQGHNFKINSIAYSPNGNQVASGCNDKTVRLWDVNDSEYAHTIHGRLDVSSVVHSPNGGQVASTSLDHKVRLWDVENGDCLHTLHFNDSVYSIKYSPKGDQIASGSFDKTVTLWDVNTGDCINTLQGHDNAIMSIAYSPKGDRIVSGSYDKSVRLWDVATGNCLHNLQGHDEQVSIVVYSPKGNQIASGSQDKTLRLWDVDAGDCVRILRGHSNWVTIAVYSSKGNQIASGGYDKTVKLWDVDTGDCIRTMQGHNGHITGIMYSPKGNQIVSGSKDYTIRQWDIETGECVHILQAHTSEVTSVMYSRDGNLIASGSNDRTARLWDASNGECVVTISDFKENVSSVSLETTFNGQYLVTGSIDKSMRRWQIIKEGPEHKALLCWSSLHEVLTVSGATFKDVRGLTQPNQKLLSQRGANISISPSE
ncbi:hypothetical protein BGZ80_007713 [Entomortierella chlamydospora]|uniref:Arm-like repeat domain-containing protein n=1 Tax=Entomortierella chlamydospora TaxID=101097 RepID=A0A9P6N7B1_9FUNG|nr:hypothetical protein BGZ80_007713 [Entomortierella chlamydospora]